MPVWAQGDWGNCNSSGKRVIVVHVDCLIRLVLLAQGSGALLISVQVQLFSQLLPFLHHGTPVILTWGSFRTCSLFYTMEHP